MQKLFLSSTNTTDLFYGFDGNKIRRRHEIANNIEAGEKEFFTIELD